MYLICLVKKMFSILTLYIFLIMLWVAPTIGFKNYIFWLLGSFLKKYITQVWYIFLVFKSSYSILWTGRSFFVFHERFSERSFMLMNDAVNYRSLFLPMNVNWTLFIFLVNVQCSALRSQIHLGYAGQLY